MSDVTVSYKVGFRKRNGSAAVARTVTAPAAASAASPSSPARVLALAHFVERQVRSGALKDYREAAARLGISHARMSQITALLMLAPAIQAGLLLGRLHVTDGALRPVCQLVLWEEQRKALAGAR